MHNIVMIRTAYVYADQHMVLKPVSPMCYNVYIVHTYYTNIVLELCVYVHIFTFISGKFMNVYYDNISL